VDCPYHGLNIKAFVCFALPTEVFSTNTVPVCYAFSWADKHIVLQILVLVVLVLSPWSRQDLINKGNLFCLVPGCEYETDSDHSIIYIITTHLTELRSLDLPFLYTFADRDEAQSRKNILLVNGRWGDISPSAALKLFPLQMGRYFPCRWGDISPADGEIFPLQMGRYFPCDRPLSFSSVDGKIPEHFPLQMGRYFPIGGPPSIFPCRWRDICPSVAPLAFSPADGEILPHRWPP
jgi:hypothetical protein